MVDESYRYNEAVKAIESINNERIGMTQDDAKFLGSIIRDRTYINLRLYKEICAAMAEGSQTALSYFYDKLGIGI